MQEIQELQVTTMLRDGRTSYPKPLDTVLKEYLKKQLTTDVTRLEEGFKTLFRDYRQGIYEGSNAQEIFKGVLA